MAFELLVLQCAVELRVFWCAVAVCYRFEVISGVVYLRVGGRCEG